jgi:hypothetical protein
MVNGFNVRLTSDVATPFDNDTLASVSRPAPQGGQEEVEVGHRLRGIGFGGWGGMGLGGLKGWGGRGVWGGRGSATLAAARCDGGCRCAVRCIVRRTPRAQPGQPAPSAPGSPPPPAHAPAPRAAHRAAVPTQPGRRRMGHLRPDQPGRPGGQPEPRPEPPCRPAEPRLRPPFPAPLPPPLSISSPALALGTSPCPTTP